MSTRFVKFVESGLRKFRSEFSYKRKLLNKAANENTRPRQLHLEGDVEDADAQRESRAAGRHCYRENSFFSPYIPISRSVEGELKRP